MRIKSIYVRRFRGLKHADFTSCSDLNILIGRNNSGKSTALYAIELALKHLSSGRLSFPWEPPGRIADQFTQRDQTKPIEIGINFAPSTEDLNELILKINAETVGLDIAVDNLRKETDLSAVISIIGGNDPTIFVKSLYSGSIVSQQDSLRSTGARIFDCPASTAKQLANIERNSSRLQSELRDIDEAVVDPPSGLDYVFRDRETSRSLVRINPSAKNRPAIRHIEDAAKASSNIDQFREFISQRRTEIEDELGKVMERRPDDAMNAFAGAVYRPPDYARWLATRIGSTKLLHFRERRDGIGATEAQQLLLLKTRRGGQERLSSLQRTISSLLGVQIDAFEPEEAVQAPARRLGGQAEMDIDNFLIEANGAGIREALRIILDIELKAPDLVLIEEPEVHLHPGLEKIMHGYLVDKSRQVQLFVATHSSNFVDSSGRQNIYILSKSRDHASNVDRVSNEDDTLRIVDEIGLRPSAVLMFDRLLFLEGESDESVLREFARKLDIDFAAKNIGIVKMGGITKFAHYAAEATISHLSRRQIRMWFLVDRDESDDLEISRMVKKLGDQAKLIPLDRREIENFMLIPHAIVTAINAKLSQSTDLATDAGIAELIVSETEMLKERVVQLRLNRQYCGPLYPNREEGTVAEKLSAARDHLVKLTEDITAGEVRIREQLTKDWQAKSSQLVPGSELLDSIFRKYGLRYRKDIDAIRIASAMTKGDIDGVLAKILNQFVVD